VRHPLSWQRHSVRLLPLALALALVLACAPKLDTSALPPAPPPTPIVLPPVTFPADEAPHQDLTEWWYYTGHLESDDGRQWGFELVTFQVLRATLQPIYLTHFAITDQQRGQFQYVVKGSQGPQAQPPLGFAFDVDGQRMTGLNGSDALQASLDGYKVDLRPHTDRPPVLHGGGLVTFGPAGDSYYYSRTRMSLTGTIEDHGQPIAVHGLAWFDKQWGNFLVMGGGWDWFSIQLDDGTDVMLNLIRDRQGIVQLAYGTYVSPDGTFHNLDGNQFAVAPLGSWTSPHTGIVYPSGWHTTVGGSALDLTLQPVIPDQELDTHESTGLIYWEAAQSVSGTLDGRPIAGKGYVELVGYDAKPGVTTRSSRP
jgi:predicted secreted hydrolase